MPRTTNSRATLFLRLCCMRGGGRRRQQWQRCTSVQFSDHLSTYLYIRASFRGRRCNDEPFPNNIAKYEAYYTMFLSPFEFARRFQNSGKAEPAILVYELWIRSSFLMSSAVSTSMHFLRFCAESGNKLTVNSAEVVPNADEVIFQRA